jgi:hypothetical protein
MSKRVDRRNASCHLSSLENQGSLETESPAASLENDPADG